VLLAIKRPIMDELNPILRELFSQPIAFLGGFTSGLLRLSLEDDPLRSWLQQQGIRQAPPAKGQGGKQNGTGPQSISIE